MNNERIFDLENFVCFSEQSATVTQVIETENSSIAVWGIQPGQTIKAHFHPDGQDTWVLLRGTLAYYLGNSQSQVLKVGDVAIASKNQVHGAVNHSEENAVFISIYSAPTIGYEPGFI